ncbi:MAG: DUF4440 domain-containing protein [Gemmatimonadaceae bacterium]
MNPVIAFFVYLLLPLTDTGSRVLELRIRETGPQSDSVVVVGVAAKFHRALETGDTAMIRALLATDVRILEGGEVETRDQYLSHHMAADIEFTRAVRSKSKLISYSREGNVAWLVSSSTAVGSFNGRNIDSIGAELMILGRTRKGWQIRAIHWSSARRQTGS